MQSRPAPAAGDHPAGHAGDGVDPAHPVDPAGASSRMSAWRAAALFCALAAVAYLIVGVSTNYLNWGGNPDRYHLPGVASWLEGWVQWDAGWYRGIADRGYWIVAGQQSPVAFFPAYPLLMRAGGVFGSTAVAGVVITFFAGLAAATLFFVWLRDRLSSAATWTALLLFLLYPYAIYLYGVAYADALFIAAVLGAFVLLERGQPVLAGLAGAVATGARPLGVAVVAALVIRTLERRDALPWLSRSDGWLGLSVSRRGPLVALRRVQARDWGVLLSLAGLSAYCVYLWLQFDDPFAFATAEEAWGQGAGPRTWFKVAFFENVTNFDDPTSWLAYVAHPIVTLVALAFVPRVFRRFGLGYGVYALLAVGLAALATKDFFGMGRYVLAAFPCFAVAGELLVEHTRIRAWALGVSAAGLVVYLSFFARGSYLS